MEDPKPEPEPELGEAEEPELEEPEPEESDLEEPEPQSALNNELMLEVQNLCAEGDKMLARNAKLAGQPVDAEPEKARLQRLKKAREKYVAAARAIENDAIAQREQAEAAAEAEAAQARKQVAAELKLQGEDAAKIEAAQAAIEARIVLPQLNIKKQQQAVAEAEAEAVAARQVERQRLEEAGADEATIERALTAIQPKLRQVHLASEHPWWDRIHREKLLTVETQTLTMHKLITRARYRCKHLSDGV